MSETPKESYVDPQILNNMTPEGKDLVARVVEGIEADGLVISIVEGHDRKAFMPRIKRGAKE